MIIFVGLTLIYATDIPTRFFSWTSGGRLVGLFQFVTVDVAVGAKAWI